MRKYINTWSKTKWEKTLNTQFEHTSNTRNIFNLFVLVNNYLLRSRRWEIELGYTVANLIVPSTSMPMIW